MPTQWTYPTIVTQHAEVEQHIPWVESKFNAIKTPDISNYLTTTKELLHISNFTTNDIKMKTYFLFATGFNFINLPDIPVGIEVEVNVLRGGRLTDETIQLILNNEAVSGNKADYLLDMNKIYGSETDMWELTIDPINIATSDFGVGIRYQSHPSWPHRESPRLDYIRMRVW